MLCWWLFELLLVHSLFLVFKWRWPLYSENKRSIFVCHHAPQRKLAVVVYPQKRIKNSIHVFCFCWFALFFCPLFAFTLPGLLHSFRACSLKSSTKSTNRLNLSVDWEVSVVIHIHFPSSFTPLYLPILSDMGFNSGAFYFMLWNALFIVVPRWHCYMRISHLLCIGLPVICLTLRLI